MNQREEWLLNEFSNACAIRVTNQCDQECRHCCFRSSPKAVGQMSIQTCEKINAWTPNRIILNIMGGEFSILKNYPELLVALSKNRSHIRLVTNGFWVTDPKKFVKTIGLIKKASCRLVAVAISTDQWHKDSENGDVAISFIEEFDVDVKLTIMEHLPIKDVKPIGRAWDNNIAIKSQDPACQKQCNMIIREDGMICLCPFGYFPWKHFNKTTWDKAQKHVFKWRAQKIAKGMNCHLCMKSINEH